MFVRLDYQYEDYAKLSLRSWVNIVYGKMTAIDRRRRQIVINTQKVLPYDHLILCTGTQYYRVAPLVSTVFNYHTKREVEPSLDRALFGIYLMNLILILFISLVFYNINL